MAGTSACDELSRAGRVRSVWLLWLIWYVLLFWFIWLVSFNQTHETDRIDQTDEIDQLIKRRGGDYGLACGGMALIISAASSFAISFKFGR